MASSNNNARGTYRRANRNFQPVQPQEDELNQFTAVLVTISTNLRQKTPEAHELDEAEDALEEIIPELYGNPEGHFTNLIKFVTPGRRPVRAPQQPPLEDFTDANGRLKWAWKYTSRSEIGRKAKGKRLHNHTLLQIRHNARIQINHGNGPEGQLYPGIKQYIDEEFQRREITQGGKPFSCYVNVRYVHIDQSLQRAIAYVTKEDDDTPDDDGLDAVLDNLRIN